MKKTILSLVLLIITATAQSQNLKLSKEVIKDFSVSYYYKVRFEQNQNLKVWIYLAGRNLGLGIADTDIAFEQVETNTVFRDELLKQIWTYGNSSFNSDLLYLNLNSIGMKAINAKALAEYMRSKYGSTQQLQTTPTEKKEQTKSDEMVIQAEFPGGQKGLSNYLGNNLRYPDSAMNNNIQGTLVIQFAVGADGFTKDIEIIKGKEIGHGLPEEAIRVILEMPKWTPAVQKGKYVDSHHSLPIGFKLESDTTAEDTGKLFMGEKKFCDEENLWLYVVTITGNSITLKSYPGNKNSYYKNKSKAVEVITGEVRNGKIVTKDPPAYKTNRFNLERGMLYEVNNEGGYNLYTECK